jgi:hypothetical protein
MKKLDIKQLNEINDIESFFGIKGLKEDNVETKAINVLLITLSVNMVRKRKKIAESLLIHYVRTLLMNSYLMDGDVTSSYLRSKDYFNDKIS